MERIMNIHAYSNKNTSKIFNDDKTTNTLAKTEYTHYIKNKHFHILCQNRGDPIALIVGLKDVSS